MDTRLDEALEIFGFSFCFSPAHTIGSNFGHSDWVLRLSTETNWYSPGATRRLQQRLQYRDGQHRLCQSHKTQTWHRLWQRLNTMQKLYRYRNTDHFTFYTDLDKDLATTLTGPQQRLDLRILLYTVVIICTTWSVSPILSGLYFKRTMPIQSLCKIAF